ncbi:MAG: hypothetical protein U5L09_09275 [Bacteroidales bacterium]|nr:hypothetical protein [Bacteroidales bacterium]
MKTIGIIPSRYGSTRFPGKPLAIINGKSMVQRVYEQALKCPRLSTVVVATDNEAIAGHVQGFGGNVVKIGPAKKHATGTERCHEGAIASSSKGCITMWPSTYRAMSHLLTPAKSIR